MHEYAHMVMLDLSQRAGGLQQVHFEAVKDINSAVSGKDWTRYGQPYFNALLAQESAAYSRVVVDSLINNATVPVLAPNNQDMFAAIKDIVTQATGGNPARALSDFATAKTITDRVSSLVSSQGLNMLTAKDLYFNNIAQGAGAISHELTVQPLLVPAVFTDWDGSQVELGATELSDWMADLLREHGIDPAAVTVQVSYVQTEIGRTAILDFNTIQEGSPRNEFRRFDPWLRDNAWNAIHSYWDETSYANQIRNNPHLQNEVAPPLNRELPVSLAVVADLGRGFAGDAAPPLSALRLSERLIQDMAGMAPPATDLSPMPPPRPAFADSALLAVQA